MTLTLTQENFEATVTADGIVVVDCWADWCMPCKRFAPVFEAAAAKYPDVVFGKVDTQAEQELAAALQIQAIPTIMAFRDGTMVFREAGALSAAQLDELITQVQALNMDELD
ncbi:MAG: thioredoxin [Propionibacteriaceae bacterium]|nr:thioredoxin [Propionibacteriaceae bacterium]